MSVPVSHDTQPACTIQDPETFFFSLAPFTLPFECRDNVPNFRILLCVKVSDAGEGGNFAAAPEVASEPQQRWAGICVNGYAGGAEWGRVDLFCVHNLTAKQIVHSSNKREIKHKSNITGPNNINVATGSVSGKRNTAVVCLSFQLFITFLPEKQCPRQKTFNSPTVYLLPLCVAVVTVLKKTLRWSVPPTDTSLNFPPKTASLFTCESETASCLLMSIM